MERHKDKIFESERWGFGKLFDEGKSAFHQVQLAEGGALRQFLDAIKRGEIKPGEACLVIEKWDRFSRMVPDLAVNLLSEIVRAGVPIVVESPDMWVDKAALGKMDFTIISMCLQMAHEFSKNISDKLVSSWDGKRERGTLTTKTGKQGNTCPSWVMVGNDGKYELDPKKSATLREAIRLAICGYGAGAIKAEVPDCPPGLTTIFRQISLLGFYQPKKRPGKNKRIPIGDPIALYPPLIDEATFRRLQMALDSRRKARNKKTYGVPNLFTDLVIDDAKGLPMVFKRLSAKRKVNTILVNNTLRGKSIHYQIVETSLLQFLNEVSVADLTAQDRPANPEIDELENRLAFLNRRLGEVSAWLKDANYPTETVMGAITSLTEDKSKVTASLESIKRQSVNPVADTLNGARNVLQALGTVEGAELLDMRTRLKAMLRGLIKEIRLVVKDSKNGLAQVMFTNGWQKWVTIGERPFIKAVGMPIEAADTAEAQWNTRQKNTAALAAMTA